MEGLKPKYHQLKSLCDGLAKEGCRSIMDVGACTGLASHLAICAGFETTVCVEHDTEYQGVIRKSQSWALENGCCPITTIETCHVTPDTRMEPQDVIMGLAIIHWLYSCTSDFGSLDAIVAWFAAHCTEGCILEWVDPSDAAIAKLHHVDRSKDVHKEAYNETNFLSALHRYFGCVSCHPYGSPSRRFYCCTSKLDKPLTLVKAYTAHVWACPPFYVSKVYDLPKFPKESLFEREVYWLRALKGQPHIPQLLHVNPAKKEIIMEWVGHSLESRPDLLPTTWKEQLLEIVALLQRHALHYNDWLLSNLCVKDETLYLVDFQWCPKLKHDFSCDGAARTIKAKPYGDMSLSKLLGSLASLETKERGK